jgi:hypothetical protein
VVVDAADRSCFMALYMAAKRLGVKISAWRMSQLGQFLPRHLTERAAALPHKAAGADRSPSRQLWANFCRTHPQQK